MGNLADKTLKRTLFAFAIPAVLPRGTGTAQQAVCRTSAVPQSATIELFKHGARAQVRGRDRSVVAHRRSCNDIRSSSTPDTFGKKVPSLSEVGIIMPASAVSRLAIASPLHGLA